MSWTFVHCKIPDTIFPHFAKPFLAAQSFSTYTSYAIHVSYCYVPLYWSFVGGCSTKTIWLVLKGTLFGGFYSIVYFNFQTFHCYAISWMYYNQYIYSTLTFHIVFMMSFDVRVIVLGVCFWTAIIIQLYFQRGSIYCCPILKHKAHNRLCNNK